MFIQICEEFIENNALLKKIEERMDMLQAQMEDNVHLENENTVIATIDSLTKFWSVLSEEDKDYILAAQTAIDDDMKWE